MKLSIECVYGERKSAVVDMWTRLFCVDGSYHLVANNGEVVELQVRLVLSVDGLVAQKTGSSNHVGSHTVTFALLALPVQSRFTSAWCSPMKRMTFLAFFCVARGRTIHSAVVFCPS